MFRPDIGITAFLNNGDAKPWSCIFKHYHSDFVVQEILKDGKLCEITAEKQIYDQPEVKEEELNVRADAPERLSEEMRKELDEFRMNNYPTLIINVENWTKDERRDLHFYIRSFGGLDSTTNKDEISVVRLIRGRKRRMTQTDDSKKFVHFTLSKEDHDTGYSVNLVGKLLGKQSASMGFCGTKDRRAITSQRVSVHGSDPARIYKLNERLRGMMVSDASFQPTDLSLGDAWGNRFSIVLREFDNSIDEHELKKRIDDWTTDGFLNYYGDQRFGSWGNTTARIGQKILQRDWQGAVEIILSPVDGYESQLNSALKIYQKKKDAKETLDAFPGGMKFTTNEGKLLKHLCGKPNDYRNALMLLPRPSRSLYVHAYQSLVFNKILSRRSEKYGKKVLEGDLFMVDDNYVESGTINDVVLPLLCFPSRYPDNEIRDWYIELLNEDKITKEVFLELKSDFAIGESMRKFIEKPHEVNYKFAWYKNPDTVLQNFPPFSITKDEELFESQVDGGRKALIIQFNLKSGIYATMALRELLHLDLGKDEQKKLSIKLRDENKEVKADAGDQ